MLKRKHNEVIQIDLYTAIVDFQGVGVFVLHLSFK